MSDDRRVEQDRRVSVRREGKLLEAEGHIVVDRRDSDDRRKETDRRS